MAAAHAIPALLAVLGIGAPLGALPQEPAPLRDVVEAAIENPYSATLRALASCRPPADVLARELAAARSFDPVARAFLAQQLIRSIGRDYAAELLELWRANPEHRLEWRTAFAGLRPSDLVALHADADEKERAELLEVAALLDAGGYESLREMVRRRPAGERASSVRALLRRAAEDGGAAEGIDLAALATVGGSAAEVASQRDAMYALGRVKSERRTLLHLEPLLEHEDLRVLARIAAGVRAELGLPVPLSLLARAVGDPAWPVRALPDFEDETVLRAVVPAVYAHGAYCLPAPLSWGDAPERRVALSEEARIALRAALLDVVTARKEEWPPGGHPLVRPPRHYAADSRYAERQAAAAAIARLGGAEPLRLWLDARATRRLEVALPVFDALTVTRAPAQDLLAELARVVRSDDEVLAAAAADALVAGSRGAVAGDGRLALAARAGRVVRARARELAFVEYRGPVCGTGPEPLGPPADSGARLVRAACTGGAVELLDPLLRELRAATADGRLEEPPLHGVFLLDALSSLAPHLPPESAATLFDELVERTVPAAPVRHGTRRELLLVGSALGRLACTVPDDRLPRLVELWDGSGLGRYALVALRDPGPLDPARARWLLDAWPREVAPLPPMLLLAAPDRLLAALEGEPDEAAPAARALGVACEREPDRVVAWLDAGALRPERFTAAVARVRNPAPVLVVGLARAGADVDWNAELVDLVMALGPKERRELTEIAGHGSPVLAAAAAARLATIGGNERERAIGKLQELAESDDAGARRAAFRGALRADVVTSAIVAAARAARNSSEWEEHVLATAVLLRAGELTVADVLETSHYAPDVLREASVEVGPDVLRRAAKDRVDMARRALSGRGPAGLRAAVFEAAAGDPGWTAALETEILHATADPDPCVRRAAYRALAATDPRDWPLALLVHEAALDDDPSVRAVAPR